MTPTALVLGGTGALGRALVDTLLEAGIEVTGTARNVGDTPERVRKHFVELDVAKGNVRDSLSAVGTRDYIINCIGIIKPYIDDANSAERLRAIDINARFPYELASLASRSGSRVIQIATDCVFTGAKGLYDENELHDATDVYGKTKSLGEVLDPSFLNLRCSIIGRELKNKRSLLEWVLTHPAGSTLTGYTDHIWNGVTTRAFGQIVSGMMLTGHELSGTAHVVPADTVTKSELSSMILEAFGRDDVTVIPTATGAPIDRTLSTSRPELNARLWRDAGYAQIPSIRDLVMDLASGKTIYGDYR